MSQILRVWNDYLCSKCYCVIRKGDIENYNDEPMWCPVCNEHVFCIIILKREYDTTKAIGANCQAIERDIKHGIEIYHIDGEGIIEDVEHNLARNDKTY